MCRTIVPNICSIVKYVESVNQTSESKSRDARVPAPEAPKPYSWMLLSFQPPVFLLDQALIQLLEERCWPAPRLAWRELARRLGADGPAVVIGQGLVAAHPAEAGLLVLHYVLRAKELPIVAQVLVQPLGCVGQDRGQDRLEIVNDPKHDVHRRRRRLPVLLDLEPGRLAVQIHVSLAG
jgi:hypothetical protein